MFNLDKPTANWFIYYEEIGAMLDVMRFCMRRFTIGTGARG
jgi:hypothetical protein